MLSNRCHVILNRCHLILIRCCSFRRNNKSEVLAHKLQTSQGKIVTMASHKKDESTAVSEQRATLSKNAIKRMERIERAKRLRNQNKLTAKEGDLETEKDILDFTDYYYENGLRKVYPYYFDFTTYVKERWYGREILEVFVNEFHSESREHYKEQIENGNITVNGKAVSCNHKLRSNSMIVHKMHRHENPVSDAPLEIIAETEDFLVINKPSSIPCHPCGRYRYNSISFILAKDYGYTGLRFIYRLDRLTSGVFILTKNHKITSKIMKEIAHKKVQKEYVCRVVGRFPDGDVICNQPLDVISCKIGIRKVSPSGKDAKTTFQRLSYNGKTSVVKCIPHTGRTHQIRVHLQYLGYPIINDPFYNSEAFGPNRGKGGILDKSDKEIAETIMKLHNVGHWVLGENPNFNKRIEELKTKSEQSHEPPCNSSIVDDDSKSSSSHDVMECTDQAQSDVKCEEDTVLPKRQKLDTDCVQNMASNTNSQNMAGNTDCQNMAGNTDSQDMAGNTDSQNMAGNTDSQNMAGNTDSQNMAGNTDSQDMAGNTDSQDMADSTDSQNITGNTGCGQNVAVNTDIQSVSEPKKTLDRPGFDMNKWIPDENCETCKTQYVDPEKSHMILYLHALRYKGSDWEFSTPLPDWASEDWKD